MFRDENDKLKDGDLPLNPFERERSSSPAGPPRHRGAPGRPVTNYLELRARIRRLHDPATERQPDETEEEHRFRLHLAEAPAERREQDLIDHFLRDGAGDLGEHAVRLAVRMARRRPVRGRTLGEIEADPPEPPSWVVRDLIRDGLNLLTAPPKAGKSTLTRWIALCLATGTPVLDREVHAGAVLLVSLEDGEATILQDVEVMNRQIPEATSRGGRLRVPTRVPPAAKDKITVWTLASFPDGIRGVRDLCDRIEDWVLSHPEARLVVVDPLGRLAPGDTNDFSTMYAVMSPFKEVADRRGIGLVLVHHASAKAEAPKEHIARPLGSTAIAAAADLVLDMRRAAEGLSKDWILHREGRGGIEPLDLIIRRHPATRSVSVVGEAREGGDRPDVAENILAVLAEATRPLKPKEVHGDLKDYLETVPKRPTVCRTLRELAKGKRVVQDSKSKGYYIPGGEADPKNVKEKRKIAAPSQGGRRKEKKKANGSDPTPQGGEARSV